MRLYAIVLGALFLLCGCASTQFSPSGETRLAPYPGEVQVLERLPAKGSYEMLGVFIVRGVNLTSDERMFEQLKERAAAQGADAVVPQGAIRENEISQERRLAAYAIRRQ